MIADSGVDGLDISGSVPRCDQSVVGGGACGVKEPGAEGAGCGSEIAGDPTPDVAAPEGPPTAPLGVVEDDWAS